MATTNPLSEEALQLFKDIEWNFPSQTLGEDRWQILAVRNCLQPKMYVTWQLKPVLLDLGHYSRRTSSVRGGFVQLLDLEILLQYG